MIPVMTVLVAAGCTSESPQEPAAGAAATPLFVESAADTGIRFEHDFGGTGEHYFPEIVGPGGALFDFDNDGDLDVYLVQGAPLGPGADREPKSDRLYRNDLVVAADGTRKLRFTDVTAQSGIEATGYGMGVAAGDYDNDGWVDLYVTNYESNQLWRNQGDGTFTDMTDVAGVDDDRWSTSAAFADYDRDGWLDLFVATYVASRISNHKTCRSPAGRPNYCGPKSYDPTPDTLFRNRGDGTFENVTFRAGIATEDGSGLGVVAADYDLDGWLDFYVANDQLPNHLWMNRGDGTFVNRALLAGAAVNMQGESESSMGVDAGDFDNDGDDDLFMTHLTGETNTLYLNDGKGFFEDRTNATRLGAASRRFTGFGTALLDYDNDGWLDIVAANGAVSLMEELERAGDPFPFHQTNQLFHNQGDGTFRETTAEAGESFALSEVTRGTAIGDVDNDGDADIWFHNTGAPTRLLLNQVGHTRNWLGLRLVGGEHGGDRLGARVEVTLPGGRTLWRRSRTDASYLSANDPRILVGLGEADGALRVRVFWPGGGVEDWTEVPSGRYSTLVEGTGTPSRAPASAPATAAGSPS